jgi:hypothetical protein
MAGDTFAIAALRRKRARIAGEIAHAREIIARRTANATHASQIGAFSSAALR